MIDSNDPEAVIKANVDTLNDLRQRFTAAHTHLIGLLGCEESNSVKLAMEKRQEFLRKHKSVVNQLYKALQSNPVASTPAKVDGINSSRLRLPKLDVPEFNGKQEDWFEWHQSFLSLVHNNNRFSAFDKIQLLRGALKGDVKTLIKNLPLEEKSYIPAWEIINSTYGDPVKGITRYLSAVDAIPPMNDKNPKKWLRNMITHFRSYDSAIKNTFAENPDLDVQSQFLIHKFLSKANEQVAHDWELTKQTVQNFWKRWQNEYLNTLQERNKWRIVKDNVKVNDLVLVKEDTLPPTQWSIGRISELHSGQDGHTRVVSIQMKDGRNLKRSINKLALLPANE